MSKFLGVAKDELSHGQEIEVDERISASSNSLREQLENETDPSKGAGMIGYLPEGAGAVGTTVLERLRREVYVKDHMTEEQREDALLDVPLLDHTLAFRKAFAACKPGGTVFGEPEFTHNIRLQIDGYCVRETRGITFDARNSEFFYKPYSDLDKAGTHSPAFYFQGSNGTARTINPATGRPISVTCSTAGQAADFVVGDIVLITSNAPRLPWNYPLGTYTGFTGYGELNSVAAVNVGTGAVTLSRPLEGDYLATATITKLNQLKNSGLINVGKATEVDSGVLSTKELSANCGHFVSFELCEEPKHINNHVIGNRLFAGGFWDCWGGEHKGNSAKFPNPIYPPNGGHSYGFRAHRSFGVVLENNTGDGLRHLIDYTSSHQCDQANNVSLRAVSGSYTTHGFGERRITSTNDGSFGTLTGSGGWTYGNDGFAESFEGVITNFTHQGAGTGIEVASGSVDVAIINPTIKMVGAAGAGVRLLSGAKDVKVRGGKIDQSQNTASGGCIMVVPGRTTADGIAVSSAGATAGTDPVVSVTTSAPHGMLVGDAIYMGIRGAGSPESQYAGYYTVSAVGSTTTLQYIRTGVTTETLVGGTGQVWPAPLFKPSEDVSIEGTQLITGAGGFAFSGSCRGKLSLQNLKITINAASSCIVISQQLSDQPPETIDIINNSVSGTHGRTVEMSHEYASASMRVQGNRSKQFTDRFMNLSGSAGQNTARFVTGRQLMIKDNDASAPTANVAGGLINLAIWDAVRGGAEVRGNKYPLDALVGSSFNKNWEYGEFTPGFVGATTAGTVTIAGGAKASYQMDGSLFTVRVALTWSAFTGTGQMQITGIPYSSPNPVPVSVTDVSLIFTGQFTPNWTANRIQLRFIDGAVAGFGNVPVRGGGDINCMATTQMRAA